MTEHIFIGRDAALSAWCDAWSRGARVVVVAGEPGIGKSALAAEALRRVGAPVLRAGLAMARGEEEVVQAVLGAVARHVAASSATLDAIEAALREVSEAHEQGAALLLDDADAVLDALAPLMQAWLDAAPALRIVVTAREALAWPGAHRVQPPPLSSDEAVALFMAHARAAGCAQGLDEAEVRHLAHALDLHPLAIELAARRARVMSPAQLAARLERRLDLLRASGLGDEEVAHAHQRSLRALLDWSWSQLDEAARQVWAQCSVFRGGFELGDVEAVVRVEGLDEVALIDVVERLVERALLRRQADAGPRQPLRLLMPEMARLYAAERLAIEGDADACARRHLAHYSQRAQGWTEALTSASRADARQLGALDAHLDNVVVAFRRGVLDAPEAIAPLSALFAALLSTRATLTQLTAHTQELDPGDLELSRALDAIDRAQRLEREASAHTRAGQLYEASASLREAAALASEDAPALEARLLLALAGLLRRVHAHAEAFDALERAHRLAVWLGDDPTRFKAARRLGRAALEHDRLDVAARALPEALELARALGDEPRAVALHAQQARLHLRLGELVEAQACCEAGIIMARAVPEARAHAGTLRALQAEIAHELDDLDEAERLAARAVEALSERPHARQRAEVELERAWIAMSSGQLDHAAERLRHAHDAIHTARSGTLAARYELVRAAHELASAPTPATRERLDRALLAAQRRKDARHAAQALALSALYDAMQGASDAADEGLALARGHLGRAATPWDAAALEVIEALVIALDDATPAQITRAEEVLLTWRQRLDARTSEAPEAMGLGVRTSRLAFALELLRAHLAALAIAHSGVSSLEELTSELVEHALVVDEGCAWFKLPGQPRARLGRKALLRRLLHALVVQRLDAPGQALSTDALIEAGWPGEYMLPEAGANRLYVSIKRLRSLGIDAILITDSSGYLLDPEVPLIWGNATTTSS